MADNAIVPVAATGTTVAADEAVDPVLGTVKFQYVKIADGTLDGTAKAAVGANGLKVDVIQLRASYMSAIPTFALAATPTDIITIQGAANKVIRIVKFAVHFTMTTAAIANFLLIKRSALDTAGTVVADTALALDSASPAATAAVKHYTANPTALGASLGNVKNVRIVVPTPTGVISDEDGALISWKFGRDAIIGQPVLRSATECLSLNFNGAAVPAGLTLQFAEISWTEE